MTVTSTKEKLLLHICCAPCSTHPLSMLVPDYEITAFFFNPNLYPPGENEFRLEETRRYMDMLNIPLIAPEYERRSWLDSVSQFRDEKEGGERCRICFHYRLQETANYAKANNIGLFTTTLTIGPNKPASVIFPIGDALAKKNNLRFLSIDFKKKDGFKHSCSLSRDAGMYRQNYCGCEYSLRDRNIRNSNRLKQF